MKFCINNGVLKYCEEIRTNVTEFVIPEGVTAIGDNALSRYPNLKNIELPEGLRSIGLRAFEKCPNLESIRLPESLKSIGSRAFRGCSNLEKITIPENLESIGADAFGDCKKLKEINLPKGLSSIGCGRDLHLMGSDMPNEYGCSIFRGCDSLADENGYIIIDGVLYDYLGNEKTILYLPAQTKTIAAYFAVHLNDSCKSAFFKNEISSPLGDVIIPEGTATIRENAFTEINCTLVIPKSVNNIEKGAFSYTYWDVSYQSDDCVDLFYKAGPQVIHYLGDEYQWMEISPKDSVENDFYKQQGHYPYTRPAIFYTATIGLNNSTGDGQRVWADKSCPSSWIASLWGKVFPPEELKKYYRQYAWYDKVIINEKITELYSDLFEGWTSLEYVFFEDMSQIEEYGNIWEQEFQIKDIEEL